MPSVTVAIPVLNGAAHLPGVLEAIRTQRLDGQVELLVCDSGSTDASVDLARHAGARVIEIAAQEFGHGSTRNRLMSEATGELVALLTQDARPAHDRWLATLVEGFDQAEDVALVYGPYLPRAGAGRGESADLERVFGSLSVSGAARVDRLSPDERVLPARTLFGPRTYFTDANGCVRRSAWEQVPFPAVPYAEDHALSLAMLRAGHAKVFMPGAGVVHSHGYTLGQQFRRAFDDWRGLLEVYGWREPATPRHWALQLRGRLGAEWRSARAAGLAPRECAAALGEATLRHLARLAGGGLGSRADRLTPRVRSWLSLEGRDSYEPVEPPQTGGRTQGRRCRVR
ncbi:MAG TPA: glycosyltransferase [Solirubrobacteraceae bacterium]|jgi:rhamnosyltransferase|nr:glycosyltransferase [Solirubrobacteraceae bacterium]